MEIMNDLQDKQFLALELVKLAYPSNSVWDDDAIFNSYQTQLERLTGLTQDLETIKSVQDEIERLQGLIRIQAEKQDNGVKLHRLIDVVNQCKGDMEPYVYECLMTEIQTKIQ